MNKLSIVRNFAKLSKSQIQNAIGLTKCTKGLGYVTGSLFVASSVMNLLDYSKSKSEDNSKNHSLRAAGVAALISVFAFKTAGGINKVQRMLKIAEKFSTVA